MKYKRIKLKPQPNLEMPLNYYNLHCMKAYDYFNRKYRSFSPLWRNDFDDESELDNNN